MPIHDCCSRHSCTKRNLWRPFVSGLINNDEKVVSSQKHTQFKTTMGDKSVETLGSKIQFLSVWETFSPLPPPPPPKKKTMLIFLFLRLPRPQHLHNIELGGRGYKRINAKIKEFKNPSVIFQRCLNYFCRPLSGVYLCKLWRLLLYFQAVASLFLQKPLNVWFIVICD